MEIRPLRVLLVDDDEAGYLNIRELLSEIKGSEHELEWVASFDRALEWIVRNQHDVYLIDYHLGDRSGLELLRDALRLGCRAPMILVTGQGEREVDMEAMKAGAADYLVQDQINSTMLERSIRYAVELSRVDMERNTLQQQLRHAQKMEAVGQMAGGVAHDFNNLLTAILGYAQMGATLAERDGRIKTYFQEIHKAAQRAADLTRRLLAFSRRQDAQRRVIDLNELILNTDKMLRRFIGEDIELVTITGPALGQVSQDPGQVEQVLINLAINARDAIAGCGKLTIETYNATIADRYAALNAEVVPGEYVVMAVSDTGSGMTQEVKERVFEPFFTTKEQGKGTGLGLSICYGMVKQAGGHISVYSELGKGTVFKIYLPRTDNGAVTRSYLDYSHLLPQGKEVVLLVEDEERVRTMAAMVLRDNGYTVIEAENGAEALRVAEGSDRGAIDLLLTNIVMPLMGGKELVDRIREAGNVSSVLFTSGFTSAATVRRGLLRTEDVPLLPKPFTPDALLVRVRQVLDLHAASTENGPGSSGHGVGDSSHPAERSAIA
jgi:signal transduction histidine kinase